MSGIGRGRGRGRGTVTGDKKETNQPGDKNNTPSTDDEVRNPGTGIDINQVSTLVQSMSLEADEISKDMVSNAVIRYADTESHLEEILRVLYIRILQDWKYGKHMAYVCAKLVRLPKLGVAFRSSLIRRIQSDFNNRDTDREEKPRTFLGCMAFLCQVLNQLRNADGDPFRPLVYPVYRGLEMLLDSNASDKEMEVAATQLLDVGPLLQKLDAKEMRKLMKTVREKILDTTVTLENRKRMLKLLEMYSSRWQPLPDDDEADRESGSDSNPSVTKSNSVNQEKEQSPKHTSPKRVSFKETTEVSTSSGYEIRPTYGSSYKSDSSDFGGVWENPPDYSENDKKQGARSSWLSQSDNDAGQWEDRYTESWE